MKNDINQMSFIHPLLREMVSDLENSLGIEFTQTSLYRINDSGVHGQLPLRGMDLRCRDKEFGEFVCNWIDKRWLYDPFRKEMKCCIAHGSGNGYHLHFQVNPKTRRR